MMDNMNRNTSIKKEKRTRKNAILTNIAMSLLLMLIAVCAVPPFTMVQAMEEAQAPAAKAVLESPEELSVSNSKRRIEAELGAESEDEELNSSDGFVRTYSVFTIPPFEVRLTLPNSASGLDLLGASKDLEQVTHDYIMEQTKKQLVVPNYLHSSKLDAYLRVAGYVNTGTDGNHNRHKRLLRGEQQHPQQVGHFSHRRTEGGEAKVRNQMFIVAEFSGHMAFNDDAIRPSIGQERIHQNDVRNFITKAFQARQSQGEDEEDYYMTMIRNSHNELFHSLIDVHVITNIDLFEGDEPLKSFTSDGDIADESDLASPNQDNSRNQALQEQDNGGVGALSGSESIAVFSMGAFLVVFIAAAYVYVSYQHRSHRRDEMFNPKNETFDMGYDESSGSDNEDCFEDVDGGSDLTVIPRESAPESAPESARSRNLPENASANDKYHTIRSKELVPVPARPTTIDKKHIEKKMLSRSYGGDIGAPVRRQYVQPASPFDVLYGAAFLHKDHKQVEKSYYKSGVSSKGTNPRRKNRPRNKPHGAMMANPMMSIAETAEEEEVESGFGLHDSDTSFAPAGVPPPGAAGGAFQIITNPINNMLNRITGGYAHGYEGLGNDGVNEGEYYDPVSNTTKPYYQDSDLDDDDVKEQQHLDENSPRGVTQLLFGEDAVIAETDKNLVFRDFPRHDGTPCLMYTPKDEIEVKGNSDMGINFMNGDEESRENEFGNTTDHPSSFVMTEKESEDESILNDSTHSELSSTSIDNFVDKLERLMAHRTRQYQERLAMDKEREKRKKQREEERKKRPQMTKINNDGDNNDQEQGKSNMDNAVTMETEGRANNCTSGHANRENKDISAITASDQQEQKDGDMLGNNNSNNDSNNTRLNIDDKSLIGDDSIVAMAVHSTNVKTDKEDGHETENTKEEEHQFSLEQKDNTTSVMTTNVDSLAMVDTAKMENQQLTTQDINIDENIVREESNLNVVNTEQVSPPEEVRAKKDYNDQEHEPKEQKVKPSPLASSQSSVSDNVSVLSSSSSLEDNPIDDYPQQHLDNKGENIAISAPLDTTEPSNCIIDANSTSEDNDRCAVDDGVLT